MEFEKMIWMNFLQNRNPVTDTANKLNDYQGAKGGMDKLGDGGWHTYTIDTKYEIGQCDFPGSPDSMLPVQGARVLSLVRELSHDVLYGKKLSKIADENLSCTSGNPAQCSVVT